MSSMLEDSRRTGDTAENGARPGDMRRGDTTRPGDTDTEDTGGGKESSPSTVADLRMNSNNEYIANFAKNDRIKREEGEEEECDKGIASALTPKNVSIFGGDNLSVEQLIKADIFSCDLHWAVFVAAAKSYRFDSILQPFPPMYKMTDGKNMLAVKEVISMMPKLSASSNFWSELTTDCQDLFSWVLNAGQFRLKLQERNTAMKLVKELTGQIGETAEPNFVFEVLHSQQSEEKFESLRAGRKCFHGYHGSRFDNFFSILHNGLNTNLNKVSVFGEGTYLSSELSVSLMYSQAAPVSQSSLLGTKLSCVAVCQMIDDPSVKCQIKEGSETRQRQRAKASKTTDLVPEKYYVVQRDDVIRVKYLLVYREEASQSVRQVKTAAVSRTSSWVREHKFVLMMFAYVLLLVAIGMSNSRHTKKYLDKFWKYLGFK